MKATIINKRLFLIGLAVLSGACSQQQVHLQTIYRSNDCALREPVIKPINTSAELSEIIRSRPVNFAQTPAVVPEVDYDTQALILYALGQKPTTGYSIELYSDKATIKDHTLYLPVRVLQPESGIMQAQVITSPCQVYALPQADFAEIVVENSQAD